MAVRDIFKISRKTFFNPSGWLNLSSLIEQNRVMGNIIKDIFSKPTVATTEVPSFDAMAKTKGLTEKDIQDGIGTYRALAFVFLLLGLAATFYAGYLVFRYRTWQGGLLAVVTAALFYSQMFKYDFWALQMRRRNLGLKFADWKRQYIG
jgi:hypothetical protein